jgi:K+-sensing histidine kinase KdpD
MDALRRRPRELDYGSDFMALAVGVFGSIVLSVAMIPLRDHLQNDVMALALVIPVLLAAVLGGRVPGALSALTAAICFDFFFTLPYQSLRIADGDDISTFFVLLIVALIAAEVGIRARRGGRAAREARSDLDRLCRVIEIAARRGDIEDVISSARAELIGLFGLIDCTFESDDERATDRPRLTIHGALEGTPLVAAHSDFLLPPGGVEIEVVGRGTHFGRLVMFAAEPIRASLQKRAVAVAIADQLGLTLATKSAT